MEQGIGHCPHDASRGRSPCGQIDQSRDAAHDFGLPDNSVKTAASMGHFTRPEFAGGPFLPILQVNCSTQLVNFTKSKALLERFW
jgi:hypothetical protein